MSIITTSLGLEAKCSCFYLQHRLSFACTQAFARDGLWGFAHYRAGVSSEAPTAYAETLLEVTWRYLRRYHTAGTFRSAGPKTYFVEILEPLGSVEDNT